MASSTEPYLVPNARIKPQNLRNVLNGHGKLYLGNLTYEADFIPPVAPSIQYMRRTVDPAAVDTADTPLEAILFGSIASTPVQNDTETTISIQCPDWARFGYSHEEFKTMFMIQSGVLANPPLQDSEAFFGLPGFTTRRDWHVGGGIVIDLCNKDKAAVLISYDANRGEHVEQDATRSGVGFPYKRGDTVVVYANFYRVKRQESVSERYRGYHVVARFVKQVRELDSRHVHGVDCGCNQERQSQANLREDLAVEEAASDSSTMRSVSM
ncbi:hypothetical protein R3P38DRAFT_3196025 [Favolaschia claudopus]|uniref:Uncharacterized protein n=1 Tax=Favolaschia claudopus TaxID=2862362 RepID=A0AAW0B9F8_9AGAR